MKRFGVLVVFFILVQTIRSLPKTRLATKTIDNMERIKDEVKGQVIPAESALWRDLADNVDCLEKMSDDNQEIFSDTSLQPSRQLKRTVSTGGKPLLGAPTIPKSFHLSDKNIGFIAPRPYSVGKPFAPFPTFPQITVYVKSASGVLRHERLSLHPGMTLNDAIQQADNRFLLKHPLEASPFACNIAMSMHNKCLVYSNCGKLPATKRFEWIITLAKNGESKYRSACVPAMLMTKGDEVVVEYLPRKQNTLKG